jgi:hypothetical protein
VHCRECCKLIAKQASRKRFLRIPFGYERQSHRGQIMVGSEHDVPVLDEGKSMLREVQIDIRRVCRTATKPTQKWVGFA